MPCCPSIVQTFANQLSTTVPYGGEFGETPTISVYYLIGGVWTVAGVFTSINLIGNPVNSILVDHGGPATGMIKVF